MKPEHAGDDAIDMFQLGRVGALPACAVTDMVARETLSELERFRIRWGSLRVEGERLADLLHSLVPTLVDRALRNRVLRVRRDVFNGRMARASDVDELPMAIRVLLDEWNAARAECDKTLVGLDGLLRSERNAARRALQSVVTSDEFREGLQLSSEALYQNLRRFCAADPAKWNARLEQIERGLLRYVTRTSMKATPFASFCAILPVRGTAGEAGSISITREIGQRVTHVRLNKAIYGLIWAALKNDQVTRQKLMIERNPTIEQAGGQYRFLSVVDGREVFQRVVAHPGIDAVLRRLGSTGGIRLELVLNDLVADESLEATQEDVRAYVDGLLKIGALRFRSPVAEQQVDWDSALVTFLQSVDSPQSERVIAFLTTLRSLTAAYESASSDDRTMLLGQVRDAVRGALTEFGAPRQAFHQLPIYEDCTATAHVALVVDPGIARAVLRLSRVATMIGRLGSPRSEQANMRHVFDRLYAPRASVPVLKYYEDYYKTFLKEQRRKELAAERGADSLAGRRISRNPFELGDVKKIEAARDALIEMVGRKWSESIEGSQICVSESELDAILSTLDLPDGKRRSAAVFCQVLPAGGEIAEPLIIWKGAQLLTGFGKMASRFLYMLPDTSRLRICQQNASAPSSVIVAEIRGGAHFNANLHERLTPTEIADPTSESQAPPNSLSVVNLEVERDPVNSSALRLLDTVTGRVVVPLDLGFLNPTKRPPLFQLLAQFCPFNGASLPMPDHPATMYLPDSTQGDTDAAGNGTHRVLRRPRIVYDHRVVLARACWTIPSALVPRRPRGENDLAFFERIQGWRESNGIPRQVYMRLRPVYKRNTNSVAAADHRSFEATLTTVVDVVHTNPAQTDRRLSSDVVAATNGDAVEMAVNPEEGPSGFIGRRSRDWSKPQYIDFANPLLLGLFEHSWGDLDAFVVTLEEALPRPEQFPKDADGSARAVELVVQLELTDWEVPGSETV